MSSKQIQNGSEPPNKNPLAALEDERNEHDQKVPQIDEILEKDVNSHYI